MRDWYASDTANARPVAGISSCLTGAPVRYDGTGRYQPVIASVLGERMNLVAFCPEVAAGLGVPRPTIQIIRDDRGQRVVEVDDPAHDVTAAIERASADIATAVTGEPRLTGYIFKARSPSCAVGSAPVAGRDGLVVDGVTAAAVRHRGNGIAIVDEEDLAEAANCLRFLKRCLLGLEYRRLAASELPAWRGHYHWLWQEIGATDDVEPLRLAADSRDSDWCRIDGLLGPVPPQLDPLPI